MALTSSAAPSSGGSALWSDFQNRKKQHDMEKEALQRRELQQAQQIRNEEMRARERASAEQQAVQRERERQRAAERAAREAEDDAEFDLMGQSNMMASFEQNGILS